MVPIEEQIKILIKQWQSMSDRPIDRDWVHNNLKSDEESLKELQPLLDELIEDY